MGTQAAVMRAPASAVKQDERAASFAGAQREPSERARAVAIASRAPSSFAAVPVFAPGEDARVCSAFPRLALQRKLAIGAVNDPLEHEADRVAEQVMRMPASATVPRASPLQLSRKCAECEEEKGKLQRKSAGQPAPQTAPPVVHEVLRSPGQPLDAATRAFFEPRFGRGFSDVCVHVGAEAAASARAVNALAYTVGHDVVFGENHYGPRSPEGKRLLAHELAHVAQQTGVPGRPGSVSPVVQRDDGGVPVQPDLHVRLQQRLQQIPPNYDEAALMLNGMSPHDIDQEVGALAHDARIEVFKAAMRTMLFWPPPQRVADAIYRADVAAARQGRIDFFHDRLSRSDWRSAAVALNGFNDSDINVMLTSPPLTTGQLAAVRDAAIKFMAGWNDHVVRPIQDLVPTRPDPALARDIGFELEPSSRPAPPPSGSPAPPPARVPWDGRTGAPGEAAARAAMQTELFAAFDAFLTFYRRATVAVLTQRRQRRVDMNAPAAAPTGAAPAPTGVVDIANQARAVLETRYATSMDAAAPSASMTAARAARTTAPGAQNIFDPYSEAERTTLRGEADLAPGVAWWLFENDTPGAAGAAGSRRFATEILADHHYSAEDPGAEQFRQDVADAYARATTLAPNNRRQLIDFRLTGWSERGSAGITLLSSFDPGANAISAELVQRWEIFRAATHESLHLRAHPAFSAAARGRDTMLEGFPEMFTVDTLNRDVLPRVRCGRLEPLRRTVEGALSPPAPNVRIITDRVSPAAYAAPRAQAERIRDGGTPPGGGAHAGVGEAAVRAAYFQGHVEYLGLAPAGQQLTALPARGALAQLRIPYNIVGLDDLAARSGVPRATIERDNPGITNNLPATAVLAGCREHWVVAGETLALIATQNGVSEADLVRANPDLFADPFSGAWLLPAEGQQILVPLR